MDNLLKFISTYGAVLSAFGAAVAFIWSAFQFFTVRAHEARSREFEIFHRLIKELVEPSDKGDMYVDRQCAILYELRFFPRYYPFTKRTLLGLQTKWALTAMNFPRILEELDITLNIIDKRINAIFWRAFRVNGK